MYQFIMRFFRERFILFVSLTHLHKVHIIFHIKQIIIDSGNGLVPCWHQAITWINDELSYAPYQLLQKIIIWLISLRKFDIMKNVVCPIATMLQMNVNTF